MNKMIKMTVLATALLGSASLFANTGASVNGQLSTSAEVQSNNKGLISTLNQGVHNTAEKVGHCIEKGVENTKEFSKEKWKDTKEFSADKTANAKAKTQHVKDKLSKDTKATQQGVKDKSKLAKEKLAETSKNTKDKLSDASVKAKHTTQAGWNKTKEALAPKKGEAGLNSDAHLQVSTPVGSAKAGLNTTSHVKTQ